ncbi:PHM/PNGase F domain-containing protein [Chytridium lagenaria]|nr:PHM/PNGase F domain-containing protein [Chytridium lagenaria]
MSSPPTDVRVLEIRMPNITIPTQDTSYLCTHFSMPADTKYHVVRVEGLPSKNHIHHMIVYGCDRAPAKEGDLYDCVNMDMSCGQFAFSWVCVDVHFFLSALTDMSCNRCLVLLRMIIHLSGYPCGNRFKRESIFQSSSALHESNGNCWCY